MNALEAEKLETYYGKSHILHGVSFSVVEGRVTTLLGRNGAGKTTTLRTVMGLTPPKSGSVRIFGKKTDLWPPYRIASLGVGYVPEGRRVFPNLTVEENLRVPAIRPGPWSLPKIFQLFPRLSERRKNLGRQLSGGEQEMLSISRALLINPQLLILDEPSQGLAPLIVQEVFRVIEKMQAEGIAVLLVEQNAALSLEVSDRVFVIDDGKIVHSGDAKELQRDQALVRRLAGAGDVAGTPPSAVSVPEHAKD